ncbi:MAG: glycoside hydrolase family 3 N-terminal domain-containing protein, partial [Candidatus Fimadaptatus sp.]
MFEHAIEKMTLEEKAALCSGLDFWHSCAVPQADVPSVMMTDGPHGLRKQAAGADHLGINESVPATCFPSGAGLCSSWDTSLIADVARAIAREAQAGEVGIVLGPAVNIKRSPLWGRNLEYYSEDPYLAGEMAVS